MGVEMGVEMSAYAVYEELARLQARLKREMYVKMEEEVRQILRKYAKCVEKHGVKTIETV